MKKITRIGIGGPVGSGKTAIVEAITPLLLDLGIKVLIITNDVVTTEDAKHVQRTLKGILLAERFRPQPRTDSVDGLTWRQALLIGLFQCLALWPGISRSAATIIGGLFGGLERRAAARYSFLAAIPAVTAAAGYDLLKSWHLLRATDLLPFAVGFAVAFLVAWGTVRTFLALLGRLTLRPFAWYRIAAAPLVYWLVR